MFKNRLSYVLPFSFMFCVYMSQTPSLAQVKRSAVPPATSHPSYSTTAFDLSRTTLPAEFLGNDPQAIFAVLEGKASQFTKSDFETTTAFDTRLAAFEQTAFLDGMRPNSSFAFSIKPKASYDADHGVLTARLDDDPYYSFSQIAVNLRTSARSLGSYIGSNAFGVKKTIQKIARTDTDLAVDKPAWLLASYVREISYLEETGFKVSLTPDEASQTVGTLRILLVGTLTAPFIELRSEHDEATLDDPRDVVINTRTLHINLNAVWLYDITSGRIIKKFDRSSFESEWPLLITGTPPSKSSLLIRGTADNTELRSEITELTSGRSVTLHAKSQIHLETTIFSGDQPPGTVTRGDSNLAWDCRSKYSSSTMKVCTLDIH